MKRSIDKLITSLLKLFEDEHSASPCLWLFGCFGHNRIKRREEKSKRLRRVLSLTSTELVDVLSYATFIGIIWKSLTDAEFVDVLSYATFFYIGTIGISLTSTELVDVLSYTT